jgi:hypothetical protein
MGTDLGVLPFSAESSYGRQALSTVLAAARAHCNGAFQLKNGRIVVETKIPIEPPVSAIGLVGGIVRVLVQINPYIETIRLYQAFKPRVDAAKKVGPRSSKKIR